MKNYIIVKACFQMEDENTNHTLTDRNAEQHKLAVDIRVVNIDQISGFGPSNLKGIQTIHMQDGYSFLVMEDLESLFLRICPDGNPEDLIITDDTKFPENNIEDNNDESGYNDLI